MITILNFIKPNFGCLYEVEKLARKNLYVHATLQIITIVDI